MDTIARKMIISKKIVVPSSVIAIGILCTSLTLVTSVVYIAACIAALVYGKLCFVPEYFSMFTLLYMVYFLDETCEAADGVSTLGLTNYHSIFIMLLLSVVTSFLTCCVSLIVINILTQKTNWQNIKMFFCIFIGLYISALIVDLTFAIHLGLDFEHLTNLKFQDRMLESIRLLRIGIMVLITFVLKGYIIHLLNIIMIFVNIGLFSKIRYNNAHPIHQFSGVINGFDHEHSGSIVNFTPPQNQTPLNRSESQHDRSISIVNVAPPQIRTPPIRSESHRFTDPVSTKTDSLHYMRGRPFSYLEESKPTYSSSSSTINNISRWNTEPPIPKPDYDNDNFKLKPVLKRTYM